MLRLGVFGGKYMTDCRQEFPRSWFIGAKLCAERHDARLNYFGVNASQSLAVWRRRAPGRRPPNLPLSRKSTPYPGCAACAEQNRRARTIGATMVPRIPGNPLLPVAAPARATRLTVKRKARVSPVRTGRIVPHALA